MRNERAVRRSRGPHLRRSLRAGLGRWLALRRPGPELRSFERDRHRLGAMPGLRLPPRPVALDRIVGSAGRVDDFDRRFRPRRHELQVRLGRLELAFLGRPLPPIEVAELEGRFYVVDGHHRVALARRRGNAGIDAFVTRWRPAGRKAGPAA